MILTARRNSDGAAIGAVLLECETCGTLDLAIEETRVAGNAFLIGVKCHNCGAQDTIGVEQDPDAW